MPAVRCCFAAILPRRARQSEVGYRGCPSLSGRKYTPHSTQGYARLIMAIIRGSTLSSAPTNPTHLSRPLGSGGDDDAAPSLLRRPLLESPDARSVLPEDDPAPPPLDPPSPERRGGRRRELPDTVVVSNAAVGMSMYLPTSGSRLIFRWRCRRCCRCSSSFFFRSMRRVRRQRSRGPTGCSAGGDGRNDDDDDDDGEADDGSRFCSGETSAEKGLSSGLSLRGLMSLLSWRLRRTSPGARVDALRT
mmetsp:Transcript_50301/g.151457  ORF Transcript_50301/g.151457 Transcript_50301/m.151457 type:complete len:247 (+) Transcript_50301:884-1624(+)